MMKTYLRTIVLIAAAAMLMPMLFALTGCAADEEEPGISYIDWDDHDNRSGQFVEALLNGDFSIAAEGFDEDMTRMLDVKGLRKAWRDTVRVAGEFISMEETESVENDEYDIYHVVTRHNRRDINTRIVFSHDGLIAGLFFTFI